MAACDYQTTGKRADKLGCAVLGSLSDQRKSRGQVCASRSSRQAWPFQTRMAGCRWASRVHGLGFWMSGRQR